MAEVNYQSQHYRVRHPEVPPIKTEREVMAEKEQIETLEKGNIYFFYRPKVDVADEISKAEDVQDFYFVLGPESGKRYRIINMGRDRMPGKNRKERT